MRGERAARVRDHFADADLRTATGPPGPNGTARQRRKNRAVTIFVPYVVHREVDTADTFAGLLDVYARKRSSLVGSWDEQVIRLADQLVRGVSGQDDEFLDRDHGDEVAKRGYPHECADPISWPWQSATAYVRSHLTATVISPGICSGDTADVEDLLRAVSALRTGMRNGIRMLFYWGGFVARGSESAGCGCVGLKEIWDRAQSCDT